MTKPLLAIDQGTTGTTALVIRRRRAHARPRDGRVPAALPAARVGSSTSPTTSGARSRRPVCAALEAARDRRRRSRASASPTSARRRCVWDRKTGEPIHRAIVWQCRRTADVCDELKAKGHAARIRERTGLVIDAYFSGTKIAWILDHVPGARARAPTRASSRSAPSTAFLVHKLTGGATHVTDVTQRLAHAALRARARSTGTTSMLALFRVPRAVLPKVVGSAEVVGETRGLSFLARRHPHRGHRGRSAGGALRAGVLRARRREVHLRHRRLRAHERRRGAHPLGAERLVTTVAWRVGGETTYALEGSSLHRRRGRAVAARRARAHQERRRDRGARARGRVERRRDVRARPLRPRRAVLGSGRARHHRRADARHDRGAPRARHARGHRVLGLRPARGDGEGRRRSGSHRLRVDGGASTNDLLMQFQADIARRHASSVRSTSSRPAAARPCSRAWASASSARPTPRKWCASSAPSAPKMAEGERPSTGSLGRSRRSSPFPVGRPPANCSNEVPLRPFLSACHPYGFIIGSFPAFRSVTPSS